MPTKRPLRRHAVIQPLDISYRYIPLSRGQNAIVDAEDFYWLMEFNWHADIHHSKTHFYAKTNVWIDGKWHTQSMHRLILGCKKGEQGDHKNRNTLDNRRENIRKCTPFQNARNKKSWGKTSQYKGVSFWSLGKKWKASITFNNNRKHLGFFDSEKDAAHAYDSAANIYHGQFAHLNFPIVPES